MGISPIRAQLGNLSLDCLIEQRFEIYRCLVDGHLDRCHSEQNCGPLILHFDKLAIQRVALVLAEERLHFAVGVIFAVLIVPFRLNFNTVSRSLRRLVILKESVIPLVRASAPALLVRASGWLLEVLDPYSPTDPLTVVAPLTAPPASADSTMVTATAVAAPLLLPFPLGSWMGTFPRPGMKRNFWSSATSLHLRTPPRTVSIFRWENSADLIVRLSGSGVDPSRR